jgi:hypothetical protein
MIDCRMKRTEVKTDRQTIHCISNRTSSSEASHTVLQPDKSMIRCRIGWLYVATDKRLYVPTQLLPDSHTAGCLFDGLCYRTDSRTAERINNRMVVRTSLRMCVQLSWVQ